MNAHSAAGAANLIGAWTLRFAKWEIVDTGERVDMYGPAPRGAISFAASQRMVALITADNPISPKTDAERATQMKDMMVGSPGTELEFAL